MDIIVSHWYCPHCEVAGRDHEPEPACWNCGAAAVVTARPRAEGEPPALSA
ncbi:hypothetical protein [Actinomycetospora cinnamomea]|uniref:Uncharacterized protein n=1 Tax=Actinomycetospora cinnamomea TaxID=663609 RepID=A0A2U1FQ10_9PSEU|nr:hypothetical protein [Actinomycetospora cinnamomea]PVZ14271.1 hypothetical protein C8D89_101135 [Actinomycetospora cinnamomea]